MAAFGRLAGVAEQLKYSLLALWLSGSVLADHPPFLCPREIKSHHQSVSSGYPLVVLHFGG